MRMWKVVTGAVTVLGLSVLALAWAPAVSGQQSWTISKDDGQDRQIVVRQRGPAIVRPGLAPMGEGVRLGVSIRDVTADDVAKMKLPGQSGVLIEDVEQDTAAAKGGVSKGDVVVSFDGESVRSAQQLTRLVRETPAGRTVKMAVLRDGKKVDLSVAPDVSKDPSVAVWIDEKGMRADIEREIERVRPEIERRRQEFHSPSMPMGPMGQFRFFDDGGGMTFGMAVGRGRLGVSVQDLTPDLAEYFGVKDGVLVSSVQKDTPAAKAGMKAGDVITAIDTKSVESSAELIDQLREKDGDVSVTVMRDKKPLTLKATLEKKEEPKRRVIVRGIPT